MTMTLCKTVHDACVHRDGINAVDTGRLLSGVIQPYLTACTDTVDRHSVDAALEMFVRARDALSECEAVTTVCATIQ